MTEQQPWDKRDGETSKTYARFCVFRDMGPLRTLPKLAELIDVPHRTLKLSSQNQEWYPRAEAYDAYIDGLVREQNEKNIIEMTTRHASQAKSLQEKAFRLAFDPAMEGDELDLSKKVWILNTISGAYERLAKLERLSRGESTENIQKEDDGLIAIANALKDAEEE